jgi:tripartite-type tricarboxylate transporter receptor subunit TctC
LGLGEQAVERGDVGLGGGDQGVWIGGTAGGDAAGLRQSDADLGLGVLQLAGHSGVGGAGHLAGALLDRMAGVRTIHVPYRGGGPLMTDLLSGKTDFAFSTAPTALPQVEGGRLRALAVVTAQRSALLPDLPTVAETLPGYEVANWYALVGPRGLPAPIVARLNAAMRETMADAEVRGHLARHGVEPLPGSPEELARFIRVETEKWAPIVRESGAAVE